MTEERRVILSSVGLTLLAIVLSGARGEHPTVFDAIDLMVLLGVLWTLVRIAETLRKIANKP